MWSVNNHIHNRTGFWGPVDANHSFCEPHYAVSPYCAEFFNSVSSLVFVVLAVSLRFPGGDRLVRASQVWLALIGLGSITFHGSMRRTMQLCDEVPMVGFVATLLVAKIVKPHPRVPDKLVPWLSGAAVLFSVALCACYVVFDQYEIFVHGFTLQCAVDGVLVHTMERHPLHGREQFRASIMSLVWILLGRVAWETEHNLCGRYPQLWPLHVLWHFLSCASAYNSMVFAYLARAKDDAELPRWIFSSQKKKVE